MGSNPSSSVNAMSTGSHIGEQVGERGMTEPDNFILRCARLKSESETPHETHSSRIGSVPVLKEMGLGPR